MQSVTILMGLPGSGKSTWAKHQVKELSNTAIINKDSLRTMINGKYVFDPKQELIVSFMTSHLIEGLLYSGYDIIIDECNINKIKRNFYIELVKDISKSESIPVTIKGVFFRHRKDNLERRMQDARGISGDEWRRVIDTMRDNFEFPTIEEGFDSLVTI